MLRMWEETTPTLSAHSTRPLPSEGEDYGEFVVSQILSGLAKVSRIRVVRPWPVYPSIADARCRTGTLARL